MANTKRDEPQEERQILFFKVLVDSKGNLAKAREAADYSNQYAHVLVRKYKNFWLDKIEDKLLLTGMRAAATFEDILNSEDPNVDVKGADLKMKAGNQVLDRIGISRTDKVQVDVVSDGGIFILPKKDAVRED